MKYRIVCRNWHTGMYYGETVTGVPLGRFGFFATHRDPTYGRKLDFVPTGHRIGYVPHDTDVKAVSAMVRKIEAITFLEEWQAIADNKGRGIKKILGGERFDVIIDITTGLL